MYYYFLKRTICTAILLLFCAYYSGAEDLRLKTVAIDAGHGGKDPGAVSKDGKTYEKTLTLDIALTLGAMIKESFSDVNVVYTRTKDQTVSLSDRAVKANKANADLFISIHINSTKSTSPNGYSVHLLGKSSNKDRDLFAYNMDVCRRENSVILLEEDYSTKYEGFDPSDPESFIFMQLMQNAHLEQSLEFAQKVSAKLAHSPIKANRGIWQNPFMVLWRTSMPSALVELGFISNTSDLSTLRTKDGRDALAKALFEAFAEYKQLYDGTVDYTRPSEPDTLTANTAKPEARPSSEAHTPGDKKYGVQIFAGSTRLKKGDKRFLGYDPMIVEGKLLKYIIGVSDTRAAASDILAKVKNTYPDAFLVEISDGEVKLSK